MADTKKPSLTVLGGPMAGTRFVFEEGTQHISVGSDESFLQKVLAEAAEEAERIAPECMIQSNIEIV